MSMKMRSLPDGKEKVKTCRENSDHMEELSVLFFLHLYLFDMHEEHFYRNSSAKNHSCHHLLTLMLLQNLYDFLASVGHKWRCLRMQMVTLFHAVITNRDFSSFKKDAKAL